MATDLSTFRNIGIAAHIDAGKTTSTERILFYTGASHRVGEVDDGTTVTDFDKQEQQRGITIYSAAVSCPWKGYTINLIDTPGHVDFTAEVERSLRVLDGMVAVFDAKEGVEAQSETVWRQGDKYAVPRICFINKMDKAGADFEASVRSIEERFGVNVIPVQIPIGREIEFEGMVDLIAMKALYFEGADGGSKIQVREIPADLLSDAQVARAELVEKICETDDQLAERFLADEEIPNDELVAGLRAATIANELCPVLCGSALSFRGIRPLLDAVCDYLPSPLDMPSFSAKSPDGKREMEIANDPSQPLAALVFKIISEKPVDLYFLRIYSGTMKPNSRIFNPQTGEKENITRLFRMYAKRRDILESAGAGEIVGVVGPKIALTGHTLCDPNRPVVLEPIEFPDTVVAQSIEPASSRDREKLFDALGALAKQDPTFRFRTDEETGQTIISGMGELHLEVLAKRIVDDLNVDVRIGKPRVSYREAVSRPAEVEERLIKELGGKSQFAAVRLRLEPAEGDDDSQDVFQSSVPPGTIDDVFLAAIKTGVTDAALGGPLLGYPMINWKATLLHAEQHETDSTEVAFEIAAGMAFTRAAEEGHTTLMEPIMAVEIRTPDQYFGAINADLHARRSIITDTDISGKDRVIQVEVPLAEMFGYTTQLRSLSQGRATASMEPLRYAAVPSQVANTMLAT
ncbi:MAG: elongation factor G [Planctomycetes bacterium]|nr:elongation factor G [Planctomycetota bacterium]